MSTSSSNLSRTFSVRNKSTRSSSPVESLLRRTRSVRLTKKEREDEIKIPSRTPRIFETPVRLITQSSLNLSLPKLYSRNTTAHGVQSRERSVSPPALDAQLWRSRSVRRSRRPNVTARNVHFHVTSCTRCLSRGTVQCYCNYVSRLTTDFFTLASSYPRLPEAHTTSRYTSSTLSRRSPSMTSMSSLSQAYGGYYDRRSTSLPRRSSTMVNRVGLLY